MIFTYFIEQKMAAKGLVFTIPFLWLPFLYFKHSVNFLSYASTLAIIMHRKYTRINYRYWN